MYNAPVPRMHSSPGSPKADFWSDPDALTGDTLSGCMASAGSTRHDTPPYQYAWHDAHKDDVLDGTEWQRSDDRELAPQAMKSLMNDKEEADESSEGQYLMESTGI